LTFTYTNIPVIDEQHIVEKDYQVGTPTHYAKTTFVPLKVLYVKYKGRKLDISEYKLRHLKNVGYVVVFPIQPDLEGAIIVSYIYNLKDQPYTEGLDIILHNVDGSDDESTQHNFIKVRNFPISDPTITNPIVIKDKNGESKTYTDLSTIDIEGEGRELIRVKDEFTPQAVTVSYYYAEGQLGELWKEKKQLTEDVDDLQYFIDDIDGQQTTLIQEAKYKYETVVGDGTTSGMYELILKKLVVGDLIAQYNEIKAEAAVIKAYWDTNGANVLNWDWDSYKIFSEDLIHFRNKLFAFSYNFSNDQYRNKKYTYLTLLSEFYNEQISINFDVVNTKTYDYTGRIEGILGTVANLIDDDKTTYYGESNDYALKLALDTDHYLVRSDLTYLNDNLSDSGNLRLDELKVHFGSDPTVTPETYLISNQELNEVYKDVIDEEDLHKYNHRTEVRESLKDEDGAPIGVDYDNLDFEHYTLVLRNTLMLFKKSYLGTNRISELNLSKPKDDLITMYEELVLSNLHANLQAVLDGAEAYSIQYEGFFRLNWWRGDNTAGVEWSGGFDDRGDSDCHDSTQYAEATADLSWAHVEGDINTMITAAWNMPVFVYGDITPPSLKTVIDDWIAETVALPTGIDLDNMFKIWNRKYEEARSEYVSALNRKWNKQIEKIEKLSLLDQYGTLDVPIGA